METIWRVQLCAIGLNIVRWSPNSKWLGCHGDGVCIADVATGEIVIRIACREWDQLAAFAWKGDSEAFAYVDGRKILVRSFPDGKMFASWEMSYPVSCLEWVRDTHCILAGTDDGSIWRLDSQNPDKSIRFITNQVHDHVRTLAIHPHGNLLASAGNGGGVQIWDLIGEQQVGSVSESDLKLRRNENVPLAPGVAEVAWSPKGDLLAICTTKETVVLWSPLEQQIVSELQGHSKRVFSVSFHPNRPILTTVSLDSTLRHWNADVR